MARICFPSLLILLCQIFLNSHLADSNETTQNQECKDFTCGFLVTVGFPFSESSRPDCGLINLDCAAKPHPPTLDLVGKKYEVVEKDGNFLRVLDRDLENLLKNSSCETFYKNLSLPQSPVVSYDVYHYLTLFRCDLGSDKSGLAGLGSYNKCSGHEGGGFVVFYKQRPYDDPINYGYVVDRDTPAGCSRIELPIPLSTENKPNGDGPFGLLNSSFLLEWKVSGDCYECRDRGGRCIVDENNRYRCSKGKVNFRLVLRAVVGAVGCVVAILVIFMVVRYKRRRRNSLYALSRNTSSDGGDLEGSNKDYGVPIFSHKELQKATNHFASSRELGDGGFGTVYYGKLQDGREVAVKYLYEHNYKRMEQFVNEIEILARIRHPNLVTLYGCTSRRSRELLLVYEYIPNGTVADHLHGARAKDGYLIWSIRMNIAVETARALAYLHASDIIHRDVKTANILLNDHFCVKVADFGLSRLFPTDVTHVSTAPQGTPGYVDPEYHKCYQLTDKSDVYSFGVVLIELVSSMPAVDINRHRDEINLSDLALKRILNCQFSELVDQTLGFESNLAVRRMTTLVAELGFQCLQLDKEMRPTMEEVLQRLVEIQGNDYGDEIEKKSENGVSNLHPKSIEIPNSPESEIPQSPEADDVVLLKKFKVPVSPNSVIHKWVSTTSSIASTHE
ncbi:PREDICTED: LEAF RUST 10 DISEASE-RESISTANCE LOCUS RECEPTOR-LIKE PROTEIN KINASE-like 1.1 [Ipomoea nil]|uniref:LEAF RUST 10 DISEASE-RESISTANCE LOCUS RECEPTOR-LIKE PROTEIN KINASE-like 1.1 n=1 Tax=Ipomoea nil TaxID=35883 RepID=UPI00090084EB|nr:PREDICTED: LEAF RUST 10 DISEASE-RESISTANCE LOCUS RECEPTOR-LIKE PROTEIN KINASE-like 1.1 [Ipomoea nil]